MLAFPGEVLGPLAGPLEPLASFVELIGVTLVI